MRILYLTQVFELEEDFGSDRHHFISRKLLEKGHEVAAITSNINYKTSKPKYKSNRFKPVRIYHNGLDIFYVYSTGNFQGSFLKRVVYYISFLAFSLTALRWINKADVVYAVSTPLSVGVLGYIFCKIFKAKFIFEVTDLWPDVFIEMGLLKNRLILNTLRKMELFCYRKANKIIALGKGIQERIQKRVVDKDKVHIITNGVDESLFSLDRDDLVELKEIKKTYGLEDKFICMYLGAHGLYNSLHTIIHTANLLKDDEDIRFVLIGDGDQKNRLQEMVRNYKLHNVIFIPPIPRKKAPTWLKVSDVFLLPNLKGKFYEMNLQNKFFDFLASARPIIFAGKGNSADIMEDSGAGKIVEPEDYLSVASAINEMKSLSQHERDTIGKNGRNYVLSHFERNTLAMRLVQLIENV